MSRSCDQQTSMTTNVVNDTAYSSASALSWTRTNVADASEPETFRPIKKRNFYLSHLHLAPPIGVIPSEYRRDLLHHKIRVPGLSRGIVVVVA